MIRTFKAEVIITHPNSLDACRCDQMSSLKMRYNIFSDVQANLGVHDRTPVVVIITEILCQLVSSRGIPVSQAVAPLCDLA